VKRILRGIPVDDATKALDVMDTVGPGGHYLEHDHTYTRPIALRAARRGRSRLNWENWTAAGSKSYRDRVHERVVELLEAETEPLMDEKMFQEIKRVCESADARHKDEELDFQLFV